jgi:hypothetical protein
LFCVLCFDLFRFLGFSCFVGIWLDAEFCEFLELLWDLLFWVSIVFTGFSVL